MKKFMIFAVLGLCVPMSGCVTVPEVGEAISPGRLSGALSSSQATQADRAETPAPGSEFSAFLSYALARNSEIRALRQAQGVAESGVDRVAAQTRPQVNGSVSGGAYRDDISSGTSEAGAALVSKSRNFYMTAARFLAQSACRSSKWRSLKVRLLWRAIASEPKPRAPGRACGRPGLRWLPPPRCKMRCARM